MILQILIEYWNDIQGIYKNIHEYNPGKKEVNLLYLETKRAIFIVNIIYTFIVNFVKSLV